MLIHQNTLVCIMVVSLTSRLPGSVSVISHFYPQCLTHHLACVGYLVIVSKIYSFPDGWEGRREIKDVGEREKLSEMARKGKKKRKEKGLKGGRKESILTYVFGSSHYSL